MNPASPSRLAVPLLCRGDVHFVTITHDGTVAGVEVDSHPDGDAETVAAAFGSRSCPCLDARRAIREDSPRVFANRGYTDTPNLLYGSAAIAVLASWHPPNVNPLVDQTRTGGALVAAMSQIAPVDLWAQQPRCHNGSFPSLPSDLLRGRDRWNGHDWDAVRLPSDLWEAAWDLHGGITPWAAKWWADRGYLPYESVAMWQRLTAA